MATMPPAPGRFSISTGCPSARFSLSPMMRAIRSGAAPAGEGMMMRMGFCGQAAVCAKAPAVVMPASSAAAVSLKMVLRLMVSARAH